jgi:hypothetical protein
VELIHLLLNRILCVGAGERGRDDVTIHVHEVT